MQIFRIGILHNREHQDHLKSACRFVDYVFCHFDSNSKVLQFWMQICRIYLHYICWNTAGLLVEKLWYICLTYIQLTCYISQPELLDIWSEKADTDFRLKIHVNNLETLKVGILDIDWPNLLSYSFPPVSPSDTYRCYFHEPDGARSLRVYTGIIFEVLFW